jgi:hypothetical protein
MPRDRAAKLHDAGVRGIAGTTLLDRLNSSLCRSSRRIEVRLADAEIEHVLARGLTATSLRRNGDGFRGFEVREIGGEAVGHLAENSTEEGKGVAGRIDCRLPNAAC